MEEEVLRHVVVVIAFERACSGDMVDVLEVEVYG